MKLLLTSNGLSNESIAKAFQGLICKEPKDAKIAFIPTAAHAERANKHWRIDDLYRIKQKGYYVDVIELTAVKSNKLEEILKPFDCIFVGGGNTFYLSHWMQKSGLFDLMPELLKTKVYVGISAGSIITGKSLALSSPAMKHPKEFEDGDYDLIGPDGESSEKTLKLVNYIIRPHLNSRYFSLVKKNILEEKAKATGETVYAIDDDSALVFIDGVTDVVSEGEWVKI